MYSNIIKSSLGSIRVSSIFYLLYFVLLTKPYSIQAYPLAETSWDILCMLISVFYGFRLLARFEVDRPLILLCMFCLLYCMLTCANYPERLLGAISESLRIIMMYWTVMHLCRLHHESGLRVISICYSLILYADAGSILYSFAVFGFDSTYSLLGYDNNAIFDIIPMLAIVFYSAYSRLRAYGMNSNILLLLCIACKVITGAATSMLALMLFAVTLFIIRFSKSILNIINIKSALMMVVASTIGLAFLHIERYFTWLFNLLGKDVTLSYRTVIWEHSIEAIVNQPLGYGKTGNGIFQQLTGFSPLYDLAANHTHNYALELLFVSGIPGTVIYLLFLIDVAVKCKYTKQTSILLAGVIAYAILMITDSYLFIPSFYALLAILASTQLITRIENTK